MIVNYVRVLLFAALLSLAPLGAMGQSTQPQVKQQKKPVVTATVVERHKKEKEVVTATLVEQPKEEVAVTVDAAEERNLEQERREQEQAKKKALEVIQKGVLSWSNLREFAALSLGENATKNAVEEISWQLKARGFQDKVVEQDEQDKIARTLSKLFSVECTFVDAWSFHNETSVFFLSDLVLCQTVEGDPVLGYVLPDETNGEWDSSLLLPLANSVESTKKATMWESSFFNYLWGNLRIWRGQHKGLSYYFVMDRSHRQRRLEAIRKREAQEQALYSRGLEERQGHEWAKAQQTFEELKKLNPAKTELVNREIARTKYDEQVFIGEEHWEVHQYQDALVAFVAAQSIVERDLESDLAILGLEDKISSCKAIVEKLARRATEPLAYQEADPEDYTIHQAELEKGMLAAVVKLTDKLDDCTIAFRASLDTLGNKTHSVALRQGRKLGKKLTKALESVLKTIELKPYSIGPYNFNLDAEWVVSMTYSKTHGSVFKGEEITPSEPLATALTQVTEKLSDAPMGKYDFDRLYVKHNDGSETDSVVLTKVHSYGGAANALLSVLIPGMGNYRTTFGQNKGFGTTFLTYGLIGAGVGMHLYESKQRGGHSLEEYKAMYQQMPSKEQEVKFVEAAHYGKYVAWGLAAIVWIEDIISVASRGSKNTKAQREYRKVQLTPGYDPNTNAPMLGMTVKF